MADIPSTICINPSDFNNRVPSFFPANGRYYGFSNRNADGNYCFNLLPVFGGNRRKRNRVIGCIDPDALAFFAAVVANGGSLTDLEKATICQYVKDLKSSDIWNSELADYPMVGGTSNSCSVNLKKPGTFDLTFVNTVSGDFTSNGWKPNGVNSYARTGLDPSIVTPEYVGLEYYSREDANGALVDIGCYDGANYALLSANLSTSAYFFGYTGLPAPANTVVGAVSKGDFFGSIKDEAGSFVQRLFKNGTQIASANEMVGVYPSFEIYLGCYNSSGVATAFTTRQCAGTAILDATTFDDTKVLAFYNARQAMNTTLGRQV